MYVDGNSSDVLKVNVDLLNTSLQMVFHLPDVRINAIAIDWITRNIYYINSQEASIYVWNVELNTSRAVITSSLGNPRRILMGSALR